MKNSDKDNFRELMIGAGEIYTKEITKPLLKIYFNTLENLDINQVSEAFTKHIKNTDKEANFFPKPCDLIRQISGTSKDNDQAVEDKANLAWHVVQNSISRIGSYGTLELEDKQALAAIQAIGGWKYICSVNTDKMTWEHKNFIAAYKNYEKTPLEALPHNLPGREALESHKSQQAGSLKSITDGLKVYQKKNNTKAEK